MLELLDIRFSFFCRTTHSNTDGKHPIILRISFRQGRRDLFTGLYCSKVDWDSNTTSVLKTDKEAVSKNRNLEIILRKANNVFDSLRFSGEEFSIDELVEKLK
ncbi:MAG: Arm DNA-binding domain-containing protein, partial [Chitinophagales bacterium]